MAQVTTLGVDLAKNGVCVHGVDTHRHVLVKKRLARQQVLPCVAQLPPCLIGMEASDDAHYWAQELTKLEHTVQRMSPQFVKPSIQSQKHDPNDAAGICEAVERPWMRGVSVQSVSQQDVQALHPRAADQNPDRVHQSNPWTAGGIWDRDPAAVLTSSAQTAFLGGPYMR